MKKGLGILIGILVVILLLVIGVVSKYNTIVSLNEDVKNAYSNVDTQLERRADLIPNLVSTVKGYVQHEEKVISDVTTARENLLKASNAKELSDASNKLDTAINALMVIVENYPELKADTSFIALQDSLEGTENRIAVARKDYNDTVKIYNSAIKKFPTNICTRGRILMKERIFLFLLLLIVFIPTRVLALDVVKPTEDFYVNDYADILNEDTKKYIQNQSINLYNKTSSQVVVVTVNNLNGASIEDYSLEVARSFEIGDSEKDNGILLIVSKEDREIRIEAGYGLEGVITDSKAGRILDNYVIPYLRDNEWDKGIINGYKAIYKEVSEYYKLEGKVDEPSKKVDNFNDLLISITAMLLVAKVIGTIGLFGIDLDTVKKKIIGFIIFEGISLIITAGSFFAGAGTDAFMLLGLGTVMNILAVLLYFESSGSSYYGGGSGGSYHSSGHSYSSHHGGGGHFGGGGASRRF